MSDTYKRLTARRFEAIHGRPPANADGPETILQFGEGNFLRAFCDWMVHKANRAGVYGGRIVVVQPRNRPQGAVSVLTEQDGLYSVLTRGRRGDEVVDEIEIVESVSRGINPYTHWKTLLACAENPLLRFVLSNTTEAGVVYAPTERPRGECPASFPAKLTEVLYRRWLCYDGSQASGLIVLPCELIDRNGEVLREIIGRHAGDWSLEEGFSTWLDSACEFCNTLVDRIVPGFPTDDAEGVFERLGCEDKLVAACEPYHIWAIEAPHSVRRQLPLDACEGVNLVWTDDLEPYRYRKVRILNGGHMTMVPVGLLSGCELVGQALDDPVVGPFVRATMEKEILPTLEMDPAESRAYLADTLDRFANPFNHHKLHTISLNSTSKFRVRLLCTLLEYVPKHDGAIPRRMALVFAALMAMYRGTERREALLVCRHGQTERLMNDASATLEAWAAHWKRYDENGDAMALCRAVLADADWWGRDLNEVPGLSETVGDCLRRILRGELRSLMEALT